MGIAYKTPKVGILGGGQLGRMLIQAGIDLDVSFSVLEPDPMAPCHQLCDFHVGDIMDYQTVLDFGRSCDVVTIEIEHVNVAALKQLAAEGTRVFPQPEVIECIQDKRTQKRFYQANGIPTANFVLTERVQDVLDQASFLPAVHKLGMGGYDGRGVVVMKTIDDLKHAFDAPGVLEKWVDFKHEIAVQVARNQQGEVSTYPVVEMSFHPEANLVEYLFAPAAIAPDLAAEAQRIAVRVIEALDMVGILAVEMFVTPGGGILVNEAAPRPHNSGHQTIESNRTSQYQQHLRAILNLPLGNTSLVSPAVMVNLLGAEGASGPAKYEGLEAAMKLQDVYVHLYGKKTTKPFRKMGHVTILGPDVGSVKEKADQVRKSIKVTA